MSQTTTPLDQHTATAEPLLVGIARAVAAGLGRGEFYEFQMSRTAERVAADYTDEEVVAAWHVFRHQETVDGKADMKHMRFAMAHEHQRRARAALAGLSSAEIVDRYENDPTPFSVGPGMLERSNVEACERELEARGGEDYWDALDIFLDARAARGDDEASFRGQHAALFRQILDA